MTYRIAIGVNIDANGAKAGAVVSQKAVKSIGESADEARTKMLALINSSTGLGNSAANSNMREWTGALASQGLAIDNLRAKYNPLFATIQRYKEAQVEIRTALAMGALSSNEYSAAMARERTATLATIDAIKGRNIALSQQQSGGNQRPQGGANQQFQTANLAFQGQDIFATAAFMPWYTVALQQGPQVAAVLQNVENKSLALRGALMSLVSPWSLISVAAVGVIAAAVQYFTSADEAAKKTNDELERQRELLIQVANTWGDAVPHLKDYADQLLRAKEAADLMGASNSLADQQWKQARQDVAALRDDFQAMIAQVEASGGSATEVGALMKAFEGAAAAVDNGREDTAAFKLVIDELSGTIRNTGSPLLDEFKIKFGALAGAIAAAAKQAAILRNEGLTALAGGSSVQDVLSRSTFKDDWRIDLETKKLERDGNIRQPSSFVPAIAPRPDSRPLIELDGLPGSDKLDKGIRSAANSYRDLLKSADDRIAQMKLEAQLAGETGIAAETLRFKLDLLQDAEDKGRSISPKQVEAINARVEAFKRYAEEAAKAKLQADILFSNDQLGRSTFDQQIATQLRGAGLSVDFESYEAGLIRTNLQLEYSRELAGDFASTFLGGIEQGQSAWEAFGNAGVSVLKKISDTLLNDVLNSLFQVQGAASGGGGLFGSLFGGLFGGGAQAPTFLNNGFDTSPMASFDRGGYTGPGGIREPRGTVHAGEVVFSQADVARHGGVAEVEAFRLSMGGYSDGGVVGVDPLMSRRQTMGQNGSAGGGLGTLSIKIGLEADAEANISPVIRHHIEQDAPGYAMRVVEDYRDRGLASDVLNVMDNPRARGNG